MRSTCRSFLLSCCLVAHGFEGRAYPVTGSVNVTSDNLVILNMYIQVIGLVCLIGELCQCRLDVKTFPFYKIMKTNKSNNKKRRATPNELQGAGPRDQLSRWIVRLPRNAIESKYIVTSNSNTAINAGLNISTSLVAQNISNSGRIGNSIRIKSLQLRFSAFHNPLGNPGQNTRIIVFVDTVNQGSTTFVGNILENVGSDIIVESPYNHINVIQSGQYLILYDRILRTSLQGPSTAHLSFKRNTIIDVEYAGASGTIADMKRNNVVVLVAGDSGATGSTYRWTMKSEFADP